MLVRLGCLDPFGSLGREERSLRGASASDWRVRTLYPPRTVTVISLPSSTGIFNSSGSFLRTATPSAVNHFRRFATTPNRSRRSALQTSRAREIRTRRQLNRQGMLDRVFIRACFDESIRQDFDEPICVGGYLFKPAAYEKFKRRWHRTVLRYRKRRFTAFHMFDLFAGNDEYEGLLAEDRTAILDAAVTAIGVHAYAGIGTYFDQAEFARSVQITVF